MEYLSGDEKDCCGLAPNQAHAPKEKIWKHFLFLFRKTIETKYPNDHGLRQTESELGGALFGYMAERDKLRQIITTALEYGCIEGYPDGCVCENIVPLCAICQLQQDLEK